jgi:hypothetical protein
MKQMYPLKIDIYSHIVPQKYKEVLSKIAPEECAFKIDPFPALYDLENWQGSQMMRWPNWFSNTHPDLRQL